MDSNYYVYVYLDPRNFEEFYYGKGHGSRKFAHLTEISDSDKVKRIESIRAENLEPIVKVVARDLTDEQAFLVEKTLIWKLGKTLTNVASGHFASNFRPHDCFHKNLPGFDFQHGIYYVNVGEGPHRCWADCRRYGFLSAGGGRNWSDQIKKLHPGDIVAAYLKGHGYVGIGTVEASAIPPEKFFQRNPPELEQPGLFRHSDAESSEFLVKINWKKTLSTHEAQWRSNSGLFSSQLVLASLASQTKTISFIEEAFGFNLDDIAS